MITLKQFMKEILGTDIPNYMEDFLSKFSKDEKIIIRKNPEKIPREILKELRSIFHEKKKKKKHSI